MAILSLILTAQVANQASLIANLTARAEIFEIKPLPPNAPSAGLAVGLDCAASNLSNILKELKNLPEIEEINLVFANFEEDLDSEGNLPCSVEEIDRLIS